MDDLNVKIVVELPPKTQGAGQAGADLFRCTNRAKVPDKFYRGGRLEGEQIAAGEAGEDTAERTGPGGGVFAVENSKAWYLRLLHIMKIARDAIFDCENSPTPASARVQR
jgi:hypothetical protein